MTVNLDNILPLVQKPARYTGGELNSVIKDKNAVDARIAFCFPDNYEIGESNLAMKILYGLYNSRPNFWCERVFAPWPDMEEQLRKNGLPLYGLESKDAVRDFDFIAFTLQYELCYTNVLNMLDLAGLPVRSSERKGLSPIVIAGGPCACNPEPMSDFIDIFILGEGEEVNLELTDLYVEYKKKGATKEEFLRAAAEIPGIYVPSLYAVTYNEDGTVDKITPRDGAPSKITKRIIHDLDSVYYPDRVVVPYINAVFDRVTHEIFRGCIRGCRFCQACFMNRPIREKSPETVNEQCKTLIKNTGYDEISLCSLSSSDFRQIEKLLSDLLDWTIADKVNVALPSLRADNFSQELLEKLKKVRSSGLTFAAEAGTQRLRDVINKNVTEEEIIRTSKIAFEGGYCAEKLYFMMGLPTETDADVLEIGALAGRVVDAFYQTQERQKGKTVNVSVSCANFVPKPFTPFQWEAQDTPDELERKQKLLKENLPSRKITVTAHDISTSFLEGVLARGDRRLCAVIEKAWRSGCTFDSWGEHFRFDIWQQTFRDTGTDPAFYANRKRSFNETLPWDHLDYGVSKAFLQKENERAHEEKTTPNCAEKCAGCGAKCLNGGVCDV